MALGLSTTWMAGTSVHHPSTTGCIIVPSNPQTVSGSAIPFTNNINQSPIPPSLLQQSDGCNSWLHQCQQGNWSTYPQTLTPTTSLLTPRHIQIPQQPKQPALGNTSASSKDGCLKLPRVLPDPHQCFTRSMQSAPPTAARQQPPTIQPIIQTHNQTQHRGWYSWTTIPVHHDALACNTRSHTQACTLSCAPLPRTLIPTNPTFSNPTNHPQSSDPTLTGWKMKYTELWQSCTKSQKNSSTIANSFVT